MAESPQRVYPTTRVPVGLSKIGSSSVACGKCSAWMFCEMARASASPAAAGTAAARTYNQNRKSIPGDGANRLPFGARPPAIQSWFMANLGFLGLGLMGYPMARNLLRAGHQVALWSHSAGKAQQLATEAKGIACDTPRQVAEKSDCIFLCVGNTAMSREVILGADGLIQGAKRGTVIADASTISPSASRAIGEALQSKGVDF